MQCAEPRHELLRIPGHDIVLLKLHVVDGVRRGSPQHFVQPIGARDVAIRRDGHAGGRQRRVRPLVEASPSAGDLMANQAGGIRIDDVHDRHLPRREGCTQIRRSRGAIDRQRAKLAGAARLETAPAQRENEMMLTI